MPFEEIKSLIKNIDGKYIIVENGKPSFVMMSWDEYRKSVESKKSVQALTEEELVGKINADISFWRQGQDKDEDTELDEIDDLEDIEYENLPGSRNLT